MPETALKGLYRIEKVQIVKWILWEDEKEGWAYKIYEILGFDAKSLYHKDCRCTLRGGKRAHKAITLEEKVKD